MPADLQRPATRPAVEVLEARELLSTLVHPRGARSIRPLLVQAPGATLPPRATRPLTLTLTAARVSPAVPTPPASMRPVLVPADRLARIASAVPQPMNVHSRPVQRAMVHLLTLQAERTPAQEADAMAWNSGPIIGRWLEIAERAIAAEEERVRQIDPIQRSGPPQTLRVFAYLAAAVSDTVLAAERMDSRWNRPTPGEMDPALEPLDVPMGARAGCPSTVAAASTAAAEVLAFLLPGQADSVRALAADAGTAQVVAGLNLPDDVQAGQQLGRMVARSIIVRIGRDRFNGSEAEVPNRPRGRQYYTLPNPLEPRAGQAQPLLLDSIQRFVDAVPPAPVPGTPAFQQQVEIMMDAVHHRTAAEAQIGIDHSPQPAYVWTPVLQRLLREQPELHADQAAAAQTAALMYGGMYDTSIAVWNVKYRDWSKRPVQVLGSDVPGTGQTGFNTVVDTPNFPSYVSGHAATSHAAAAILGTLMPSIAAELDRFAAEDSLSRLYAAVHWDVDDRVANTLGTAIGQTIVGAYRLRSLAPAPVSVAVAGL